MCLSMIKVFHGNFSKKCRKIRNTYLYCQSRNYYSDINVTKSTTTH